MLLTAGVSLYPILKLDEGLRPCRIGLLQDQDLAILLDRDRIRHHVAALPCRGVNARQVGLCLGNQPCELVPHLLADRARVDNPGSLTCRVDWSAKFAQCCFHTRILALPCGVTRRSAWRSIQILSAAKHQTQSMRTLSD